MVDDSWHRNSWEEKAQQNPLAAVMTTPAMLERGGSADFPPDLLKSFFGKGRIEFERHIQPLLTPETGLVVDYGCGAGRMLRAVADMGHRCAGVDIAPTMIRHCRTFVPEADLHVLENGRSGLPDACAGLVFSYAVVQHIPLLSAFESAIDEMCRLLAPGGRLALCVITEDFRAGDLTRPARTENFEDHSIHHPHQGQPFRHDQTNWTGVFIGHEKLLSLLSERGIAVDRWYQHNPERPRAIWYVASRPA